MVKDDQTLCWYSYTGLEIFITLFFMSAYNIVYNSEFNGDILASLPSACLLMSPGCDVIIKHSRAIVLIQVKEIF